MTRTVSRRLVLASVLAYAGARGIRGSAALASPGSAFDFRLTHWPQRFYPTEAFRLSKLARGFDLDIARTMGWASQLAYEVGVAQNEQMLQAILSNWRWEFRGFLKGNVVGFDWLKRARGYVAQSEGTTLVAFSGTEPTQITDWLTDFYFPPKRDDGIHRGFFDGVTSVWQQLQTALGGGSGILPNRLLIAGHSLGGALAAVTAFRLLQAGQIAPGQVQVVTFGMPRTGNATFADAYRTAGLGAVTYRLVHGFDVVPKVPSYEGVGFRHIGNHLACDHGGSFDVDRLATEGPEPTPVETDLGITRILGDGLQEWRVDPDTPDFPGGEAASALPNLIRDHLIDGYLRALGELKGA